MKKSTNIFNKIVLIAGILNFPIGLGTVYQAVSTKTGEDLIHSAVVGLFIMFAGAAIIWATKKLNTRASLIVWNGLVRLINVFIVAYAALGDGVSQMTLTITGMDLMLAIIFTIGTVKVTEIPFSKLIVGKTNDL